MSDRQASTPEGPAARHWRAMVEGRARQMDAAYASVGRSSKDYWARRMTNRSSRLRRRSDDGDPFLQLVLRHVTRESTVLDVGAGAGRYALAIAPHVGRLIALEPDEAMVPLLESAVGEAGLTNVEVVQSTWEAAAIEGADIAVCAHVLYPIAGAAAFLRRLDESSRDACFVALRDIVPEPEPLGRLWQRYYGEPRLLQPGYVEAFNLLYELGIHANVRVYTAPGPSRSYDSMDAAVADAREHLILPDATPSDAELRAELEPALVEEDGLFILPAESAHIGALWWQVSGRDKAGR